MEAPVTEEEVAEPAEVVLTDVDVPFTRILLLLYKIALASAVVIVSIWFFFAVIGGMLGIEELQIWP